MYKIFSKLSKLFVDYAGYGAGVVVGTGVVLSTLPDTIFLSRRRRFLGYVGGDDKEKAIGADLQAEIDKVLYRIMLKPEDEANLDFFLSSTSDPAHHGSLKMRSGAIIGLPASLEYRDDHTFKGETFSFQGIPLNVDGSDEGATSPSLETLRSSLILPTPSKHFLIAREVNYTNSHHLHFLVTLKCFLGFSAFTCYYLFDQKLKPVTSRLKGWVKLGVGGVMGLVTVLFYFSVKDAYNCWLDGVVDKETALLGKEYAEGGVDYYNSVLLRNKALRSLSGSGSKFFTSYGNETSTFRAKNLQLTTRRDHLVKLLAQFKDAEEKGEDFGAKKKDLGWGSIDLSGKNSDLGENIDDKSKVDKQVV